MILPMMFRNQLSTFLIVIISVTILSYIIIHFPSNKPVHMPKVVNAPHSLTSSPKPASLQQQVQQVSTKYVLTWAPTWYDVDVSTIITNPFQKFQDCPIKNCALTSDRSKLKDVDAVLFVMTDVHGDDFPSPASRTFEQYYIFYLEESPLTANEIWKPAEWNLPDFFNLTFTYRLDSDIFSDDYFHIYKPHLIDTAKRKATWFTDKKEVLWMVSHCKTANNREGYVAELMKYIPIDIGGKCTPNIQNPCPTRLNCPEMTFTSDYKFYLSFENSMCKEYVTEKLIRALNSDVVPIVMGGARYDVLLPPKAVINVEDYAAPEDLAKYLKFLSKNQTAYEEHLAWKYPGKDVWYLKGGIPPPEQSGFCKICEILHRPPEKRIHKSYKKILDWLEPNQCREPFVKHHYGSSDYNASLILD